MQLYRHQQDGVERLVKNDRYALFYDTGTGKTAIALSAMERVGGRWLVVCPLILIENAWIPDAKTFTPNLTTLNLRDKDAIEGPRADVEIVNYETFLRKARPIFDRGYDGIVIDESSKLKNHDSKISKHLRYAAQNVEKCWLLSGTPAPNTPFELWPQMDALQPGLCSKSFYAFRARWGESKPRRFGRRKFSEWVFREEMLPFLLEEIAPACHWLKKDECLDLPDIVTKDLFIDLSPKERRVYEEMRTTLAAEVDDEFVSVSGSMGKCMKLRQLCNGWMYHGDRPVAIATTKFAALRELLEETLDGEQVIIWTQFIQDAHQIYDAFSGQAQMLTGGLSDRIKEQTCQAFRSGIVRLLVAHPKTAQYGLTFTNCRNAVYYSLDYSAEGYNQSRDRIHRIGQTQKCTIYHLLARHTIDERCLEVVRGKITAADAVREELRADHSAFWPAHAH